MTLAKIHQMIMGSKPDLKDFVRARVLKIDHGLEDRQELNLKKSMKLTTLIQDQVFKVSSTSQTTTTYRIRIKHLLLKPYKPQAI